MATNCIRFGYEFGIAGCIFMWKIILADYVGTPTRAGARIGEKVFPQEKQRGSMLVESLGFRVELCITVCFPVSQLSTLIPQPLTLNCAQPLCGCGPTPSALSSHFPYRRRRGDRGRHSQ